MHERQAIREAVQAQLVAANTAAGSRVFTTREVPWRRVELPGIAIYALEENRGDRNLVDPTIRVLTLAIDVVVTLTEHVDDAIDDLALEVENAIEAEPTLGGHAFDLVYASTQITTGEDQNRPLGAARITYDVKYYPDR